MGSLAMHRLALGTVIVITAIVTAVLTSLFWIAAYSIALPADGGATAPAAPEGTERPQPPPTSLLAPRGWRFPSPASAPTSCPTPSPRRAAEAAARRDRYHGTGGDGGRVGR
jgi:hypothetical protein